MIRKITKYILIIPLLMTLMLYSCKAKNNNQDQNKNQECSFTLNKEYLFLNETGQILFNNNQTMIDYNINLTPNDIIEINQDGVISPLKAGNVLITLSLKNYPDKTTTKNLEILDNIPVIKALDNQSVGLYDKIIIENINELPENGINDFDIRYSNDNAFISTNGYIFYQKAGKCEITITSKNDVRRTTTIDFEISEKNSYSEPTPDIYMSRNYMSFDQMVTMSINNYSSLSDFNIILTDNNIISIDEYFRIKALAVGKVKIYLSLKTNINCTFVIDFEVIPTLPNIYVSMDKIGIDTISYYNISNLSDTLGDSLDDYLWELSNENIIFIDGYGLKGVNKGNCILTATSISNPLVKNQINIEVVDNETQLVLSIKEGYLGEIAPGEQVHLIINEQYDISNFKLQTSNSELIRIDENGLITTLNNGVGYITVYEIGNPTNNASYAFNIKGIPNVDYIKRLLNIAIGEKGYVERYDENTHEYVNDTKYNHWYNMDGAWCAMFVSWCWYQAGLSNDILLKYCSCSAGMTWCEQQGIFNYKANYKPVSGDIVFFLSSGMSHTGIVVYADDTYLYTMEGNSSNRADVWRWSLKDARITGYAHPNYPTFTGESSDFSWIKEQKPDGNYWWNNVTEKQDVL